MAVQANQGHALASAHAEVQIVQDRQGPITGRQALHLQDGGQAGVQSQSQSQIRGRCPVWLQGRIHRR
jgi:hypothetical protein